MLNLVVVVSLCVAFGVVAADVVVPSDCNRDVERVVKGAPLKGKVLAVRVSECKEVPCKLTRGQNYTFEIDFIPDFVDGTGSLDVEAYGIMFGIPMLWPGMKTKACGDFGITCPLQKGVKQTYVNKVEMSKQYPAPLDLKVKWTLLGNDRRDEYGCFTLPIKIEKEISNP